MRMSTVVGAGRLRRISTLGVATLFGSLLVATAPAALPASAAPGGVAAAAVRAPVTVSLTFDDGTDDHVQAATLMDKYGMKGTFYINSSRLDRPGRLSTAQAEHIEATGHEIGGHTVTHADLPTLDINEQKRQICDDRVSLLNAGFRVTNFAYPYGDDSTATQQAVAGCGYNSARVVGDIVSPGSCDGCAFSETIPAKNGFAIRTPDSVKPGTTLENMQNYVLQAEQNGGGWVVIVMHRLCDDCDAYAINPAKLDGFLSWLSERAAGGTVVKTVAQVVGGAVKPPVSGPQPPPPPGTSEMLRNPSMEADSNGDGVPDCWQRAGFGNNTAAWSKASAPHSGAVAQQVTISSFTDGDRRILTPQDLGACAPATVVGHAYRVSGWYRTDSASTRLVAYYRDSLNRWNYLSQSPVLAANPTGWKRALWLTPALPAGARALSVGFSLRAAGFTAADDMSLVDADQTAPTVALTSPDDGARVRGTVTFTATATDDSRVQKVEFLVDGQVVCTVLAAPYKCAYNTASKPDTVIAVTARAVDDAGNDTFSEGMNYTVSNSVPADSVAPTAQLTAPAANTPVSGMITLTANAADNDKVGRVLFYAGDELIGSTTQAPYAMAWDSRGTAQGTVQIRAKALDVSGNLGSSAPVPVILDRTGPTAKVSAPTAGATITAATYIKADVADANGIARVYFYLDGKLLGSRVVTPYQWRWDPAGVPAGAHTLNVVAVDLAGNQTRSADVGVTVG